MTDHPWTSRSRLPHAAFWFFVFLLTACLLACYSIRPSLGGGQISKAKLARARPRPTRPADVALPEGYAIEVVATGLTYPTGVTFDGQGRPCVVEAGYSYGEDWKTPRLLRIEEGGRPVEIAHGAQNGPWTGAAFHGGQFYVAEGGELEGGRILKISPAGQITPILENLPSKGDHHTNGPAIGPGGWIYFGLGTATNAGVVGPDNAQFGWLKRVPDFHDIPGRDITLTGENFTSEDPLRPDSKEKVVTGAFVPFGQRTTPGQVIKGAVPCSGAILRVRPEGGPPELVAWGLRNPFGLAFSPEGQLYVTENQYDERGSRPVFGAGDLLWAIQPGLWYGWPDYHAGTALDTPGHFKAPGKPAPRRLIAHPPNAPPQPAAILGVHSSSNGFDFSRNPAFGHVGEAFIAQFGDEAPVAGKVLEPVGYRVVRVNVKSGVIEPFAVNRGRKNGPASLLGKAGLERPVAARFNPQATALYVVDFGIMRHTRHGSQPQPGTGVLWRITRLK